MNFSVINLQDPAGKTVGRRVLEDAGTYGMGLQKLVNQVRRSQGFGGLCAKGVYRFHNHEEANTWMMRELVQRATRARR